MSQRSSRSQLTSYEQKTHQPRLQICNPKTEPMTSEAGATVYELGTAVAADLQLDCQRGARGAAICALRD